MTVDEAARILRRMLDAATPEKRRVAAFHVFGILYADDLDTLSITEILRLSGARPSFETDIRKGCTLAEYVDVVKDFP